MTTTARLVMTVALAAAVQMRLAVRLHLLVKVMRAALVEQMAEIWAVAVAVVQVPWAVRQLGEQLELAEMELQIHIQVRQLLMLAVAAERRTQMLLRQVELAGVVQVLNTQQAWMRLLEQQIVVQAVAVVCQQVGATRRRVARVL